MAFWAVLATLGAAFLGTSVFGALMVRVLPRGRRSPLGRAIMQSGFRFCLSAMRAGGIATFDTAALGALAQARGLVIAPTHPSLLDVMLVVAHVPNVVCVSKTALWDNPLLGGMVRLAGFIRNDAALPMVRAAAAELTRGANLLIFPQGTRAEHGAAAAAPLRSAVALIARASRAPVQVVFIESDTTYLRKGVSLFARPELPFHYRVQLGPRIQPEDRTAAMLMAELEPFYRTTATAAACPV